ncbi:MAG: hypothetical protein EOR72_32230 [Mesorhizobium sp.]|uniref:hypothetical protein n=1 Tax=Mesorhizobium sp. TaxID=1871066 RepID=UPI000FE6C2DB|nr:hypothetical protein [Mesorhizobium sp.]RWM06064.1 MAG: hypothetical protein EOR72_32230 [Mesorhizobium sp.]
MRDPKNDIPVKPRDGANQLEWWDYNRAFDKWIETRDAYDEWYAQRRFDRYQNRKHLWFYGAVAAFGVVMWWKGTDPLLATVSLLGAGGFYLSLYVLDIHNHVERIARVVDRLEAKDADKGAADRDLARQQHEKFLANQREELVKLVSITETPAELEGRIELARLARVEEYNTTGKTPDMTAEEISDRAKLDLLRKWRTV